MIFHEHIGTITSSELCRSVLPVRSDNMFCCLINLRLPLIAIIKHYFNVSDNFSTLALTKHKVTISLTQKPSSSFSHTFNHTILRSSTKVPSYTHKQTNINLATKKVPHFNHTILRSSTKVLSYTHKQTNINLASTQFKDFLFRNPIFNQSWFLIDFLAEKLKFNRRLYMKLKLLTS